MIAFRQALQRRMGRVTFFCALFAAGCILAQEQKPDDPKPSDAICAAIKHRMIRQDPDQTYQGPSILSRDKSLIGERGGKLLDFRYYVEVTGIYDSGWSADHNAQGNLVT